MQQRNTISFFKRKDQEVRRNAGKSKLYSLFISASLCLFFIFFFVTKIPNGNPLGMLLVYSFLIKVKVVRQANGM
jgi:F0F1-type ATP synthase assembly protein I